MHVLHDLALRIDNLQPDPDQSEVYKEVREVWLVSKQSADLATFNSLDGNRDYSHGNNNDQENAHLFGTIDSASATHNIAFFINEPLNFQYSLFKLRQGSEAKLTGSMVKLPLD